MRDGLTRKITGLLRGQTGAKAFAGRHRASLTVLTGPSSGIEHVLGGERILLGRGPGVDVMLDDESISRQHAVLVLETDGWHVQDMGSTNGIEVNGASIGATPLKHGDRITLGSIQVQYVVEDRPPAVPSHRMDSA
jgi:pSer/pThr/pTyr-binding forkhead associated (FHA) protein